MRVFSAILVLVLYCGQSSGAPTTRDADDARPPADDNAALQYWQGFSFLSGDLDTLRAAQPGDQWAAELVEQNRIAVRYLRRGAAMPHANWGLAWEQGTNCYFPHADKAKHLAQAALLTARVAAAGGQFPDALELAGDVLVLARHTASEPSLASVVVASEMQSDAVKQAVEQLPHIPDQALIALTDRVIALPPLPDFQAALRGHRRMFSEQLRIDTERRGGGVAKDAEIPAEWIERLEQFVETLDKLIEIHRMPPEQWHSAEQELYAEVRKSKIGRMNQPFLLGLALANKDRSIQRSAMQFLLFQAALSVLREGPVAAERFVDPYLNKSVVCKASPEGFELSTQVLFDGQPIVLRVARAAGAAAPTTQAREDPSDLYARIFRRQLAFRPTLLRIYIAEAEKMPANNRDALLEHLNAYDRRMEGQLQALLNHPSDLGTIMSQVEKMDDDWQKEFQGRWMAEHPDAAGAVRRAEAVLQGLASLGFDAERLLPAIRRFGLPQASEDQVRSAIDAELMRATELTEGMKNRQHQVRDLPPTDPAYMETFNDWYEMELLKIQVAQRLRSVIRNLLPAEHRAQFDDELASQAEPGYLLFSDR